MIQFNKISIEGFGSISNLELDLNTNKIILFRGATGSGKTTIFSALVWAIYGKNLKGVSEVMTWPKYRNKDYNGVKVELYFELDGSTHKITRCQKYKGEVNGAKGSDRLIYEVDAVEVKDKSKVSIQSLIAQDIGMTYSLFMNSLMFGQGMKRLIQESSNDQKAIFEEIFNLSYISKARDIAKSKFQDISSEVRVLEGKLDDCKHRVSDYESILEDIQSKGDSDSNDIEEKIAELKKKRSLLAKEQKDIDQLSLKQKLSQLNKALKDKYESIKAIKQEISNSQSISKVPLEEVISNILNLLKRGKVKEAIKSLEKIHKAFIDIRDNSNLLSDTYSDVDRLKAESEDIEDKLDRADTLESKIKDIGENIDLLKQKRSKIDHNLEKKYKEKIKLIQSEVNSLESKLKAYYKEQADYRWLYDDPLSNKGLKAYIFDSSLGYLNEVLDGYSKILGISILFYIDLEGNRKDFKTLISMDGIEVQYEELSGGQKQLVSLAMAFAMNEVMTQSKGINIAFLDEVFENLSSEYVDLVIELIRKVYRNKTLFLISHQDSLTIPGSEILQVSRHNGISNYQ